MKKYNLTEELKSQRSEGYYQMYGSRDFYKGTSFKMGKWETNTHYFNGEHIIDFVSYKGALLTCMRSHLSSVHNEPKLVYDKDVVIGIEPNQFWGFVLGNSGKGQQGDKGEPFTYEDFTQEQLASLIGLPGKDGTNGIGLVTGGTTGQALVKKSNSDYDTEWKTISGGGVIPTFSAEATAQSGSIPSATAILENDTFKFNFILPKGQDGSNIKIMYAKTTTSVPPVVNKTNPNPGPTWGTSVPIYTTLEYIWSTIAAFRDITLIGEWSDPILMTGEKGEDAISPNWKSYIYKLSDSKPEKPAGTNPNPSGWSDYPTTSGNWWQCIGTINGTTQLVIEWSEVLPVNGRDGTAQDGKFTEFRFAINTSNVTPPTLNNTIRTPNGWSTVPQNKAADSYIWMITAAINPDDTLHTNWSTPVVISGENGSNGQDGIPGTPGNDGRTSYFHIKYSAIPNPTIASQMTETPNIYIGTYVDFVQIDSDNPLDYTWSRFGGLQGEQGIPGINGEDGTTSYLHIKYSNDGGTTFTSNNGETPGAWVGIYVDNVLDDSNDPTQYKWSKLLGDTGPAGNPGPAGKDGVSGIPGVGIEVRFCLGTDIEHTGVDNLGSNREPTGWETALPIVTEEYPYIWFTQARINYTNNTDRVGTILGTWSTPSKLSGTNGLDGLPGQQGSKGQIIYPEGIYSTSIIYTCTETKAPYVYDSGNANYYVLNKLGTWQGTLHSNQTPSTDTSNSWLKLEAFEAIYAKIGIIANGLIGSAVFNGDWMFSQQGINNAGNVSTEYEEFNPNLPSGGSFTPNILFNFKTGAGHMAAGKIKFGSDGNITANNLALTGNSGFEPNTVTINGAGIGSITSLNSFIPEYDRNITLDIQFGKGDNKAFNIGKVYNGRITNNGGWLANIHANNSDFISIIYNGRGEPEGSFVGSKIVRLRNNSILDFIWSPNNYNSLGYWEGELLITNPSAFGWTGINTYTEDMVFASKGMSKTSIHSNVIAKGYIDIYSTSEIGIYFKAATEKFSASIVKINNSTLRITVPNDKKEMLQNSLWVITPTLIGSTVVSFACAITRASASTTTADIHLSTPLPSFTGIATVELIVFWYD